MPKPEDVGVGVALLVLNEKNQVLLHRRKGAHRAGCWSAPGGWIDRPDERTVDTCIREAREEAGIEVRSAAPLCWTTEDHEELGVRTITLYHYCTHEDWSGTPMVMEPHKCEGEWEWFDLDRPPSPLYPKLNQALEQLFFERLLLVE